MPTLAAVVGAAATVALIVALVVGLLTGVGTSGAGAGSSRPVTTREVAEFQANLAPILRTGGAVVELGMKPGVAEIARTARSSTDLLDRAGSWLQSMQALRSRVVTLVVPQGLSAIKSAFAAAFEEYIRTAADLLSAAHAEGPARSRLVAAAQADGRAADKAYDAAEALLSRVLASVHVSVPTSASSH